MSDEQELEVNEESDVAVEEAAEKLNLKVEIEDVGPCKKHVTVTVPEADIQTLRDIAVGELAGEAEVPGFRVGHVPTKLVEKRFKKEISGQLKQNLLMQSLEQVSTDNDLDPINEPQIDVENLEIPDEGDFEYEFEVEVRPKFALPDYEGIEIRRPTREVTDEDIENYLVQFLSQYGSLIPHEGEADAGDYVVVDLTLRHGEEVVREFEELSLCLRPILRFPDAEYQGFDELMKGAKADDVKSTTITVSTEAANIEMRGEELQAEFKVLDVKKIELPELTEEFLERLNVPSEEDLRSQVQQMLERQVTYEQRQATREQVLEKITESANWDLPEGLVRKQVDNALRREILEMQQAGFTSQQISARENELKQQSVTTTRQALKEHFVLDRIATEANLEVSPQEIDIEIQMMAIQQGDSPRKVRAKMVKSGMIENLEAQIRERKSVDLILEKATFKDVPLESSVFDHVESVNRPICSDSPVIEEHDHDHDHDGDHDHDHDHG